jgi:predicted Ser/Thr protein kinase
MSHACPSCGTTIPGDSPLGLCPRCLFLQVPVTQNAKETTDQNFRAPTVEELAPHFPQLEVIELIGQGGMGAVYRARQPGLDRSVALKILATDTSHDPTFAERFSREARVLARLNHPHIVNVYDSGRAGPYFYLLMEYVEGVNLRAVLAAGDLKPAQALAIVPQICDALQYAHEEGVVHRDIKPENILLDRRGRVKVADFGLAKLIHPGQLDHSLTGTHQVMGTLRYMAPEQLERTHAVDHRADIFSLGVVLYELLTGELPLGRFAPPSQRAAMDARLDEVVMRTLEKEPERRYQHASDVKTDLESISSPREVHERFIYPGYEYRSPTQFLGLPLVHIATGLDPATGRPRCAMGIVAIGSRAVGGLAIGGASLGIFSLGGVAAGLFSLGGCSFGLLVALGGMAIGMGLSAGGLAIGALALGGCAVGIMAIGGGAFGFYRMGGNVPGTRNFGFTSDNGQSWAPWGSGPPWGAGHPWEAEMIERGGGEAISGGPAIWMLIIVALLGLALMGFLLTVVAGVILGVRALWRERSQSPNSSTTGSSIPEEYRPPVIRKDLPGADERYADQGRGSQDGAARVGLAIGMVLFLLSLIVFSAPAGRLSASMLPLIIFAVTLGGIVWLAMNSRGCAIAIGIGCITLLALAIVLWSWVFSYRTERRIEEPRVMEHKMEMDEAVELPESADGRAIQIPAEEDLDRPRPMQPPTPPSAPREIMPQSPPD